VRFLAAVEPDQVKQGAIAAIVVLAVVAFLLMRFIQKVIVKLVVLVVLVSAGVFLYSQRSDLDECQKQVRDALARDCICSFAGVDISVPGCDRVPGG
jgi:thiol:disulfide interchange protein